jgi:hypothetical protein
MDRGLISRSAGIEEYFLSSHGEEGTLIFLRTLGVLAMQCILDQPRESSLGKSNLDLRVH